MTEFPRIQRLDAIGAGDHTIEIAATESERMAIATRFGLVAIERLGATLTVSKDAAGIAVRGRVTGAVIQACSVTDDPIAVSIDEPVALLFVEALAQADEIELGADALDIVEIEGNGIDLGDIAAETMALSLDPFPRGPGAAAALKAAGVISEEDARPAGPFAGLKDQLAGR